MSFRKKDPSSWVYLLSRETFRIFGEEKRKITCQANEMRRKQAIT